jgi:hypothetical protein
MFSICLVFLSSCVFCVYFSCFYPIEKMKKSRGVSIDFNVLLPIYHYSTCICMLESLTINRFQFCLPPTAVLTGCNMSFDKIACCSIDPFS